MGYGNYSHVAHEALSRARSQLPQQQVFQQTACHALMNPKGVRLRESRDSAEHPNSLSVVFALDVTGSMGKIPELLAKEELPKFMKILLDCNVPDTQLLFVAVGDATSDQAPLQVGQFESTAELMDRWLTWSYLEGNGGGQKHESYELAMYFLAEHTEMDCWMKRKKKGYLFMTGDELPYPAVSRHQVEALIGDRLDQDVPVAAAVAALQQTYHPFFLIPDVQRAKRWDVERTWRELLGDHVICMEAPEDTCYVAAGLVGLSERRIPDVDAVARLVESAGADKARVGAIVRALTPFAATLGADGAKPPRAVPADMPVGSGPSFWSRLSSLLK
jgi:hypothetical protein